MWGGRPYAHAVTRLSGSLFACLFQSNVLWGGHPCCNMSLWFFVCLSVSESNVLWGGHPCCNTTLWFCVDMSVSLCVWRTSQGHASLVLCLLVCFRE